MWMRALPLLVVALALGGCAGSSEPPPGTRPHDTIYLAGVRPATITVVDTTRSRVKTYRLRGVGPGDPPYMLAATGGRLVTFTLGRTFSYGARLREPQRSL